MIKIGENCSYQWYQLPSKQTPNPNSSGKKKTMTHPLAASLILIVRVSSILSSRIIRENRVNNNDNRITNM